jgi:hypothetical protein
MDRRRSQLLAVGVLLLVAAYGLPLPDEPVADEATHLLATASLWHDHDLRFDDRDLARGYAVWPGAGPRGLSLLPDPGGGDPVSPRRSSTRSSPPPSTARSAPRASAWSTRPST